MRTHPENKDRFHELLRFHMSAHRKGKDPGQVLADMRARDAREQAALLSGKCEIEVVLTHSPSCDSRIGGFMWSLPCDCTVVRSVVFREPMKQPESLTFLNSCIVGRPPDGGYDAKDEEPE